MSGYRFKFWLIVAGLAAGAVYSFWYAFKAWRKNRVIEDTPTSRVRSAAQGYVELSGQGILPADSHNRGPLSGIPCAWWRYKVEERSSAGRSRSWSTVDSDTSTEPFLLDDGTGQCLIDPCGAEVFPRPHQCVVRTRGLAAGPHSGRQRRLRLAGRQLRHR
jgi:hypothetical protein